MADELTDADLVEIFQTGTEADLELLAAPEQERLTRLLEPVDDPRAARVPEALANAETPTLSPLSRLSNLYDRPRNVVSGTALAAGQALQGDFSKAGSTLGKRVVPNYDPVDALRMLFTGKETPGQDIPFRQVFEGLGYEVPSYTTPEVRVGRSTRLEEALARSKDVRGLARMEDIPAVKVSADLPLDILGNPLTYMSGGERPLAPKVGGRTLTREGEALLKATTESEAIVQSEMLAKAGITQTPEAIMATTAVKGKSAARYAAEQALTKATQPGIFDEGGLKIMGQTLVPGSAFKSAGEGISKTLGKIPGVTQTKDAVQSLFQREGALKAAGENEAADAFAKYHKAKDAGVEKEILRTQAIFKKPDGSFIAQPEREQIRTALVAAEERSIKVLEEDLVRSGVQRKVVQREIGQLQRALDEALVDPDFDINVILKDMGDAKTYQAMLKAQPSNPKQYSKILTEELAKLPPELQKPAAEMSHHLRVIAAGEKNMGNLTHTIPNYFPRKYNDLKLFQRGARAGTGGELVTSAGGYRGHRSIKTDEAAARYAIKKGGTLETDPAIPFAERSVRYAKEKAADNLVKELKSIYSGGASSVDEAGKTLPRQEVSGGLTLAEMRSSPYGGTTVSNTFDRLRRLAKERNPSLLPKIEEAAKVGKLEDFKGSTFSKTQPLVDDIEAALDKSARQKVPRTAPKEPEIQVKDLPPIVQSHLGALRGGRSTMPPSVQWMLDKYQKGINFYKGMVYGIFPASHVQNKTTNQFLAFLGRGATNIDPEASALSRAMLQQRGANLTTDYGEVLSEKMVLDEAQRLGVMRTFGGAELGKTVKEAITPTTKLSKLVKPMDAGLALAQRIEQGDRLALFLSGLKKGMSFDDAAKNVDRFLFDYSNLSTFEKRVMRNVFPFYTFNRKAIGLFADQLIKQPRVFGSIDELQQMLSKEDVTPAEADLLPDWIKNRVTLRTGKGEVAFGPTMGFEQLLQGDIYMGSLNPLLKLGIEQGTGTDLFRKSPLREAATNITDIPEVFMDSPVGKLMGFEKNTVSREWKPEGFIWVNRYPRVLGVLRNLPTARLSSSASIMQREDDPLKALIKLATGWGLYEQTAEKEKAAQKRKGVDALKDAGVALDFKTTYVPKDVKKQLDTGTKKELRQLLKR